MRLCSRRLDNTESLCYFLCTVYVRYYRGYGRLYENILGARGLVVVPALPTFLYAAYVLYVKCVARLRTHCERVCCNSDTGEQRAVQLMAQGGDTCTESVLHQAPISPTTGEHDGIDIELSKY